MREYLPRDELVNEFQNSVEPLIALLNGETTTVVRDADVIRFLSTFPAADVRPVVPGKLIPSREYPGYLMCSVCHDCFVNPDFVKDEKWNFCPQCGTPWKKGGDGNG